MLSVRISLCCFIPAFLSHGLSVFPDDNRRLGQTLGRTIAESIQEMQAAENAHTGFASAFQRAVGEELNSKQEVLMNRRLEEVMAQANSVAEHQSNPADELCARNWKSPCPDGWGQMGAQCSAPITYEGGCGMLQDFTLASPVTKAEFAAECKAPWPCSRENTCPQGFDYTKCPEDWADVQNGFCKSTSGSSSKCADLYQFSEMGIETKQELTLVCNLTWKCKAPCESDLGAHCPQGWLDRSGICMAPASYAGGCAHSMNMTGMSQAEKRSFASKCGVLFPCTNGSGPPAQTSNKDVMGRAAPVENGPINPNTGNVVSASQTSEGVKTQLRNKEFSIAGMEGRFDIPSGPVDENGGIHF